MVNVVSRCEARHQTKTRVTGADRTHGLLPKVAVSAFSAIIRSPLELTFDSDPRIHCRLRSNRHHHAIIVRILNGTAILCLEQVGCIRLGISWFHIQTVPEELWIYVHFAWITGMQTIDIRKVVQVRSADHQFVTVDDIVG
jgi:hypothetical protein